MSIHPGVHAVKALLETSPEVIRYMAVIDRRHLDLVQMARECQIEVRHMSQEQMDHMAGHETHQGILVEAGVLEPSESLEALIERRGKKTWLLVLDQVQDPHNFGACLRSACAMGVDAVIVPERRSCPLTPTVIKVSCGATAYLPVHFVKNLARTMKQIQELGVWCIGTSEHASQEIAKADCRGALALVCGNEQSGLRHLTQEQCDTLTKLPTSGPIQSLNVSVAVGMALYACRMQRL